MLGQTSAEVMAFARQHRQEPTEAEELLWERVRRKQLHGRTFRRQHTFGKFIADFYCADAALIVELDGAYHEEPTQEERDRAREEVLQANGLSFLRFTNSEVMNRTEEVIETICNYILTHISRERKAHTNPQFIPPHLLPPPSVRNEQGEGGWGGEGSSGHIGIHLLLDFYEITADRLTNATLLAQALLEAATAACMTPLSAPVLHTFPGGGLTGFLPLAESHIAFHTYPEFGYLAADVFTCGKDPQGPDRAVAVLEAALQPGRLCVRRFQRGEEVLGSVKC